MDKNIAILLVIAVVLVGFFALDSLTPKKTLRVTSTTQAEVVPTTIAAEPSVSGNMPLSDLQITACNAADRAQTCQTRLPKLVGLVTKEECCKYLKKCC